MSQVKPWKREKDLTGIVSIFVIKQKIDCQAG